MVTRLHTDFSRVPLFPSPDSGLRRRFFRTGFFLRRISPSLFNILFVVVSATAITNRFSPPLHPSDKPEQTLPHPHRLLLARAGDSLICLTSHTASPFFFSLPRRRDSFLIQSAAVLARQPIWLLLFTLRVRLLSAYLQEFLETSAVKGLSFPSCIPAIDKPRPNASKLAVVG